MGTVARLLLLSLPLLATSCRSHLVSKIEAERVRLHDLAQQLESQIGSLILLKPDFEDEKAFHALLEKIHDFYVSQPLYAVAQVPSRAYVSQYLYPISDDTMSVVTNLVARYDSVLPKNKESDWHLEITVLGQLLMDDAHRSLLCKNTSRFADDVVVVKVICDGLRRERDLRSHVVARHLEGEIISTLTLLGPAEIAALPELVRTCIDLVEYDRVRLSVEYELLDLMRSCETHRWYTDRASTAYLREVLNLFRIVSQIGASYQLSRDPAALAEVLCMTRGATQGAAKAEHLRRWVSDHIREMMAQIEFVESNRIRLGSWWPEAVSRGSDLKTHRASSTNHLPATPPR